MTEIPKDKPYKDKKYLKWIKSLPCCVCHAPADDPHHITGTGKGGTGTKPGDNYAIPLCRGHHNELHHDPSRFEVRHGRQIEYLDRILELAKEEKRLEPYLTFITGLED